MGQFDKWLFFFELVVRLFWPFPRLLFFGFHLFGFLIGELF